MSKVLVESSNIASIDYNEDTYILGVEFKTGSEYFYENVSRTVAAEFALAESVGKYFAENIRNKYEFRQAVA